MRLVLLASKGIQKSFLLLFEPREALSKLTLERHCIKITQWRGKLCGYVFANTWTIASVWRIDMLGYLSVDIICFEKRTQSVALGKQWALRNTWCPRKNIRAHFRTKWRLLCLSSFEYFLRHEQVWKLKIFPSFSWGILSHVTCINQSLANRMFDGPKLHIIPSTHTSHSLLRRNLTNRSLS